jgi:hypothetical protein
LISAKDALKRMILAMLAPVYRVRPAAALSAVYFLKFRRLPNIGAPVVFQEKLQWLKLYYRQDRYPVCSDKYAVRGYIEAQGMGRLLNALYGHWDKASDIPFDELPERFVLKVTHGSGYNIICRRKSELDRKKAVSELERWRRRKYIECYGEWFYGVVPPRIVCEALIEGARPDEAPRDYKVHCFNGRARLIQVDAGRFSARHFRNIYDTEWRLTEIALGNLGSDPGAEVLRPPQLAEILLYAEELARPFPYVRIDFYLAEGRVVFGEMTFTPGAGFSRIRPEKYARLLGNWLSLPQKEAALCGSGAR